MAEDVFGLVGTLQAGTFQVEAAVAEGGFGVVYRAHHSAFRAPVALKCLKVPGTLSAADRQQFEEQFRAEAELLFQLSASTPTVVRPLQVGMVDSPRAEFVPFMALEWLDGQSLDELIQERRERGQPPLGVEEVVQLLRPVAYALDNAHRFPGPNGTVCILHRDMKPDNVFIANVRGHKAVRILDFGIAKVKSAATAVVGKASAQSGSLSAFTPNYGAPEQWVPKRYGQTGPWTDVYGFALTVVESICGRAPIDGDHAAMMGSALDEQLRPTPRNLGVAVSDAVEAVLTKAVAVDPRNRYQSMGEFWHALEAAVEGGAGQRMAATVQRGPAGSAARTAALSSRPPDPYGGTRVMPADGNAPAPTAIPDLIAEPPRPRAGRAPLPASGRAEHLGASTAQPGHPGAIQVRTFDAFDELEIERAAAPASAQAATSLPLQLDGVGLAPGPVGAPAARVSHVRPPRSAAASAPVRPAGVSALRERLRLPLTLIIVGSVVAASGWVYQLGTGELLTVGPVRPLFVAGPLVLIGLALGAVRLFSPSD